MGLDTSGLSGTWKSQATAAAIRQGPSFVVLVVLLAALGKFANYVVTVGVPAHLEQIKEGYVAIQGSHDRNLERVVATFKEEQERYRAIVELMERLVENRSLLRENRDLLLSMLDRLKAIHPSVEAKKEVQP